MDEFLTPKQLETKRLGESIDDISRQLDESDNVSDEDQKGLRNLKNAKEARLYALDKNINILKESGSSKVVRKEKEAKDAEKLREDNILGLEDAIAVEEEIERNRQATQIIPGENMGNIMQAMQNAQEFVPEVPEPEEPIIISPEESQPIEEDKLSKYRELLSAIKGQ